MDRIATNIERRMFTHNSLQKWEVIIWVDQKIKEAQEQAEISSFEEIIEKLPLAIMLAFDYHYRSAIYKITDTTLERIAEGASAGLQEEIIFDREKMSSPLRDFVEGEQNNLYIENASLDPRTSYMFDLIRDANINDIYFTKVETRSEVWVIVVEGIYPQKIDEEKKDFLAVLCNRIRKIELERAETLASIGKEIIATRIGTIAYLLNLLAHLFRNKITAMGGLCIKIDKIAGTCSDVDCGKCCKKTHSVIKGAREMEQILVQFDHALAELTRATVINIEPIPLPRLIKEIQAEDPSNDFIMELEDPQTDFSLLLDRRKTVKALYRMVKKLTQDNKSPIVVAARRIDKEKIKITLKQKEMNTDNLARLVNMSESGNAKDHSLSDFVVIISCCMLPELGIKIGIDKNMVEFAFQVPR
jgi:hypothetical protein